MGGGKVCNVGHAYASYLDACPYCGKELKGSVTVSPFCDGVTADFVSQYGQASR